MLLLVALQKKPAGRDISQSEYSICSSSEVGPMALEGCRHRMCIQRCVGKAGGASFMLSSAAQVAIDGVKYTQHASRA